MLKLKPSARVRGLMPEVLLALVAVDRILEREGVDCVVTSANDGKHMKGSLHYAGLAVDIRTRDLTTARLEPVVRAIRMALTSEYDVVLESDHLHLEFDPKPPAVKKGAV